MRHVLWTVAAVTFSSNVALAADLSARPVKTAPAPQPAIVAVYNWTGPYIGAHCGGAWGRTSTDNLPPFDDGLNFNDKLKPSGWLCGGQLGYNWQLGTYVLGVEGDLGYLGLKKEIIVPVSGDDPRFAQVKYNNWYGTITGRLGYAWDRWLAYGKGGAAFARIRNSNGELDNGVSDADDFSEVKKTRSGWALGGGIEHGFAPNWTVKVEYLYMDFGKDRSSNPDGFEFEYKNRVHTVKLGLNFR